MDQARFDNLVELMDRMSELLRRTDSVIDDERAALLNLDLPEVEKLSGVKKSLLDELIELRSLFRTEAEAAGWTVNRQSEESTLAGAMRPDIDNLPTDQRLLFSARYENLLLMLSQISFANRVNLAMTRGGQGLMEKTLKVMIDAAAPPKATYSRPGAYAAGSTLPVNRISSAA